MKIQKQMPANSVKLTADEVYSELANRGHTYRGNLMALTSVEISKNRKLARSEIITGVRSLEIKRFIPDLEIFLS